MIILCYKLDAIARFKPTCSGYIHHIIKINFYAEKNDYDF